ncbi:MAG: hypothetical protein ACRDVM_10355, partial [Acidimicrobiia bacterium]
FYVPLQPLLLIAAAAGALAVAEGATRRRPHWAPAVATGMVVLALVPGLISPGLRWPDRPWDQVIAYLEGDRSAPVLAFPVDRPGAPIVRLPLGYYLPERPVAEISEPALPPGTGAWYVTVLGYPEEPQWGLPAGPPEQFGDIRVYRVVWDGERFVGG